MKLMGCAPWLEFNEKVFGSRFRYNLNVLKVPDIVEHFQK